MLVRATQDFRVGPRKRVVIAKGEVYEAIGSTDSFYVELQHGCMFGNCSLSRGWEPIKKD